MRFITSAVLFVFLAGGVNRNAIHIVSGQESQKITFSLSSLESISKMINEANRCPTQTGRGPCPWVWIPDIDEDRIPRVIYKAQKLNRTECESNQHNECRQEYKRFNVMQLAPKCDGTYDLRPDVKELPVGFVCGRKPTESVVNGGHADSISDFFD